MDMISITADMFASGREDREQGSDQERIRS